MSLMTWKLLEPNGELALQEFFLGGGGTCLGNYELQIWYKNQLINKIHLLNTTNFT